MIEKRLERHHLTPILRDRTRSPHLEREAAQARLWYFLCNRRMNGFRFRENRKVGPIHADFYCFQARLIVRLDKDSPSAAQAEWLDAARHRWIVVEVDEVNQHLEKVLEMILKVCCERA